MVARSNTRSTAPVDGADALLGLATRWSAVCPSPPHDLAERLAVLLRQLAAVVEAEPFFPWGARAIGAQLPATGLAGDPDALSGHAADALPPTLRLLREEGPAVLELGPPNGERLLAALDELAAGFAGALARTASARSDATPAEHDVVAADRYLLLAGLPRAIGAGQFRLVYQPLVGLADGHVRGAEALVRWQHPEQGLIAPGRFIPLAEESGAIVELGSWVLATACAEAARWHRELGADAPYVSVNVSPVQLVEAGWADEVIAVLDRTGLPAGLLQLEITEQAVLGDGSATLDGLVALREAGVRLTLDDFGTGRSNLAWLRRLPVHGLKIDGSFIDGLRHVDADPVDAAIVSSLIGMAHALGLEVTAEWVETRAQAQRLVELGCDLGQGRWFADAGPGEWVPRWRRSVEA